MYDAVTGENHMSDHDKAARAAHLPGEGWAGMGRASSICSMVLRMLCVSSAGKSLSALPLSQARSPVQADLVNARSPV